MENIVEINTKQELNKVYKSNFELSIRRKPFIGGVPGDDPSLHNLSVGGSIRNKGALSGLTPEEERNYLPELIGMSSQSPEWNRLVKEYWNNISAKIPADGTTPNDLQGNILNFSIEFATLKDKQDFDSAKTFRERGEISKKGKVISGVSDFVLFRYCLDYSRVANEFKDAGKSAKIWFYLYSKKGETAAKHSNMKLELKASSKFQEILVKEDMVDAMLRLFSLLPETFETLQDKHMELHAKSKSNPTDFIKYAEDKSIVIKAALLEALDKGVLYQPAGTTLFYFGENHEVTLGKTLDDAVLWWKQKDEANNKVKEIIKAQLKEK